MQSDAGVAVDVVVVIEERGAEGAGVVDRPEPAGERWAVLESLELRFAVGVGARRRLHPIPLVRNELFG